MATKQQPKSDCFAFQQRAKTVDCACLKKLYCQECKCSFYMTDEQYIEKNGETYEQTIYRLENYLKGTKSYKGESGL